MNKQDNIIFVPCPSMTREEALQRTNKWWSDQYQELDRVTEKSMRAARTKIDILKAENEILKAKLENRDLNLEHLRSIIDEIESALDEKTS